VLVINQQSCKLSLHTGVRFFFFSNFYKKIWGLKEQRTPHLPYVQEISDGVWNFSKPGHEENSSCEAGLVNKMLQ